MARKRRLTGTAALHAAFSNNDHQPLLKAWGVDLQDENLRLALTHRSFANENDGLPNNERLEFLGDAVLGLSVAEQLYKQYPDHSESDISKMRASVVNMYALADIARELKLGPYVLLGRGEMRTGGEDKDSILADTVEAMLGATYLEHGFHVARSVVLTLFKEKIDNAPTVGLTMDWKTVLIERASELTLGQPCYSTTSSGPAHQQRFTAELVLRERGTDATPDDTAPIVAQSQGKGRTKKEAEHMAAKALLKELEQYPASARRK